MGLQEDMIVLCKNNEFMKHNHIKAVELLEDRAVTELVVSEDNKNPYGILHGGALFAMADCAGGLASRSDGRRYVTLSSSFNFIKSATEGTVRATATIRHRGRSTCLCDVALTDRTGALLATGSFTFFCIDAK